MKTPRVTFQAFAEEDFALLMGWLRQAHVTPWWGPSLDEQAVREKYLPRLSGEEAVQMYLILLEERPVGMIQTGPVDNISGFSARWQAVDILIGDPALIGQSLGPTVIRRFVDQVVFRQPGNDSCLTDPDLENQRSVRAFEKAGFRKLRRVLIGTRPHQLLVCHRSDRHRQPSRS